MLKLINSQFILKEESNEIKIKMKREKGQIYSLASSRRQTFSWFAAALRTGCRVIVFPPYAVLAGFRTQSGG